MNNLSDEELYDQENELWTWKKEDGYDIESVCTHCTELRVKGEPAIDNLKYIIVGVVNRGADNLFGKVLLDELRMTGVKNEKGKTQTYSWPIVAIGFRCAMDIDDAKRMGLAQDLPQIME